MRLHRFHISELIGNQIELTIHSQELVNQLRHVLRLKVGEEVILFDGSGSDYLAAISRFIGDDGVGFNLRESMRSRFMPTRKAYLCAAVIKKDNFEFIVEKATELGVTNIIPVVAERSEKKALNQERLIKISIEASEQSGRGDVPIIHPIVDLKEALGLLNSEEILNPKSEISSSLRLSEPNGLNKSEARNSNIKMIAFHTDGELFNQKELPKDEPIAIFIGPEGGWSPEEIAMFHKNKIAVRCLGPQVLRAETAVIAALSKVCL